MNFNTSLLKSLLIFMNVNTSLQQSLLPTYIYIYIYMYIIIIPCLKSSSHIHINCLAAQKFHEQISYIFQKIQKCGTWFSDFSDSRPKKIGFWALGTFLPVLLVQKFTDLFTIWRRFYKFSPMLHKSFSYEPSRRYGTSPLFETIKKITK